MRWPILLCLIVLLQPGIEARAQTAGTVAGTVTTEDGQPLAAARVSVEGTQLGALTDARGRYTIAGVPAGARVLRARLIGYLEQSRAVTVASGQTLTADFELQVEVVDLEGIVAIGYGTVRKSDLTGAVSSVQMEDAKAGVTNSVAQVLQGRVPGVQVTQASAEPGGGVAVRIRGSGSINANNEPLYVIDGLPIDNVAQVPGVPLYNNRPRNPLNALSPDDIESIEVLKDASATAIYGSRGANGVILITTRRGQRGGLQVDYEGYMGMQAPAKTLDMLSTQEYTALLNDLRADMGQAPEFTAEEIAAIGNGTDWQEEIFRSAPVTSHHLSFSGGGENHRFYAALGAFDQEGITISSGTKRYTGRMNLEQTSLGDRLTLGLNLNATYIDDDNVPLGTTINEQAGIIAAALYQDPTMGVVDDEGKYQQSTLVNVENPLGLGYAVDDVAQTNRVFGSAFAEYRLLPGLRAKVNVGADRQTVRRDFYMSTNTRRGAEENGLAQVGSNDRNSALAEFTLNYNREFGDHRFDVVGGSTYQTFERSSLFANSEFFTSDAFRSDNLGAGNRETFDVGSGRQSNQLLSYLGRVNYSLLDRYLLTVSFRADGSSRFGADSKWGYFPSAAFAWRIVDEPFLVEQRIFSDLKLRTSYGLTGNQEIGNYNSLVLLGVAGNPYFNETPRVGIAPTQVPNPDLKWETTRQFDLGVDFGFLDNRITGSADYFVKDTDDLLLNLPIPSTTGFGVMLQNVGAVHNEGWELALNTYNLTGDDFEWTTRFNAARVKNEVTDLAGLPYVIQGAAGFTRDFTILREGDPMNAYYGYIADGIWQLDDDIAGSAQPAARPGEVRFRDLDGDGEITPEDRTIIGSPFPDLTLGLGNTFGYGRFELDAFLQGSFGNEVINLNRIESENPISFRRNRLRESYTDRWTPENPTNDTPSGIPVAVSYGSVVNTRAVEDASYLRLRTVTLSYRLPSAGLGLRSASVYVTGQNLWTLTDYSGYDPDVSSFGDSNVKVDYNAYPNARTVTAGVRIGL